MRVQPRLSWRRIDCSLSVPHRANLPGPSAARPCGAEAAPLCNALRGSNRIRMERRDRSRVERMSIGDRQGVTDQFLDFLQCRNFTRIAEGERSAHSSRPGRPADAMNIALRIVGKFVVDDM